MGRHSYPHLIGSGKLRHSIQITRKALDPTLESSLAAWFLFTCLSRGCTPLGLATEPVLRVWPPRDTGGGGVLEQGSFACGQSQLWPQPDTFCPGPPPLSYLLAACTQGPFLPPSLTPSPAARAPRSHSTSILSPSPGPQCKGASWCLHLNRDRA